MNLSFEQELAQDDLEDRRRALEDIKPLYDLRAEAKDYDKGIKAFDPHASDYSKMGPLRRWLIDHDGERLHDEESGLVAYLQPAGETEAYDTERAIRERDPALHRRLMELDCFGVDASRIKDCIAKGLLAEIDIAPFRHKIARTPSLRIEREKE